MALGAVTGIVEHDDDGIEFVADGGGQLHARHLKRAVPDENQRAKFGIGHLRADAGGNGETHRSVIRRAEEFGAMPDEQIACAEERIADISDDDHVFRDEGVQALEQALHGDAAIGVRFLGRLAVYAL